MSNVNPYQPAADSDAAPARVSTAASETRHRQPLNRGLSALISVISVVLLAFSFGEIIITVVMSTPLQRTAEFTQEYDGLIIFILPIFVIPCALIVGIVLGAIGRTRLRLVISAGLSVFLSFGVGFFILAMEARPKPAFAIALVIGAALIMATWATDTILNRIAIARQAKSGTGSVSAIVAAVLSSLTIVIATALAFISEFDLTFAVLAFTYIASLTAAVIGSMYNLAAYRAQHWSSWLCLVSAMLSPVIFFLV